MIFCLALAQIRNDLTGVSLIYINRNHSVTQSTLDDPCTPLDGGFSSGLAGVGNDSAGPPPVWNLTITDDSERESDFSPVAISRI